LGTLLLPVVGTAIGGLIGGVIGSMGGDALGGYLGKSMFGGDDALKRMPAAGPLMMTNAGKEIPPVMANIGQSFAKPSGQGTGALLMAPKPGDAARAMMMPSASDDAAAAKLTPPAPAKSEGVKFDTKVDIQAPFTLTVQGDVKDAATLYNQLKPLLDQHYRDMAGKVSSTQLYDAPHV